jgi:hypothetical protein
MHDGTKLFTIDTSDVMVAVNADAWQASTSYIEGDFVENDSGKIYIATSDGDSAGSGGPTGTGTGISDNTVTWDYLETVTGGSNIPSSIIPGLVALDQYVFLADSDGNIYNSNVQDVYTWTSGDFIVAETLPDKLVQIAGTLIILLVLARRELNSFTMRQTLMEALCLRWKELFYILEHRPAPLLLI